MRSSNSLLWPLVLAALALLCIHATSSADAAPIQLDNYWTLREDGLGFDLKIRNSKFSMVLDSITEKWSGTTMAQTEAVVDSSVEVVGPVETANYTSYNQTLSLDVSPARGVATWQWIVKHFKRDASVETIDGSGDYYSVNKGDVKTNMVFDWPSGITARDERGGSPSMEVALNVTWDISLKDIIDVILNDGDTPELDFNLVRDGARIIGFEIKGDFNIKFVVPGGVKLTTRGEESLDNIDVSVVPENKGLEGKVIVKITTNNVVDRLEFDPVMAVAESSSAASLQMSVVVLALVALLALLAGLF